jgi:hypothetical protein
MLFAAALAVSFLVAHLFVLASTLEDIDAVNFALGVARFDLAKHQPHPPGYPIFIALGKVGRLLTGDVVRGLAMWGALLGALALLPLAQFFRVIEGRNDVALGATAVTAASPLLWFNASRPMSDVPGMALGLVSLALLATAFSRQKSAALAASAERRDVDAGSLVASGRLIVAGALMAGFAIGMRSQTAWLTLPLLALVIVDRAGRGAAGALLGAAMTFGAGVLAWLLPLLVAAGGPVRYWQALFSQASEDIGFVDMLATNPTFRRFAAGLLHTFVQPWANYALAGVVLGLAGVGLTAMTHGGRRGLAVLASATAPYLVFHLVFQETFTTRYALPILPAVVYLGVRGLAGAGRLALGAGSAAIVAASLVITSPALAAYARDGSPVWRMLADLRTRATVPAERPLLLMHHPFVIALRGETLGLDRLPAVRLRPLIDRWVAGRREPVWFLAEPGPNGLDRHHDLALVDAGARRVAGDYRWPFDGWRFVGGVRPSEVTWFVLHPPRWMLLEGWALTPVIAGRDDRQGMGPGTAEGITGYVARDAGDQRMLVGGRHLGGAGTSPVGVTITIDGRPFQSWRVAPDREFFLKIFDLPASVVAGDGAYARIVVRAAAVGGGPAPVRAAIEQFDVKPAGALLWGYDDGWHEAEHSLQTLRLWRWTSDRAKLRVTPTGRDLTVTLTGESPLRYFDAPPEVRIAAAGRTLQSLAPAADFSWTVNAPAAAVEASGGVLELTTSRTFVPNERSGNGDRRRLGLRTYSVTVSERGRVR